MTESAQVLRVVGFMIAFGSCFDSLGGLGRITVSIVLRLGLRKSAAGRGRGFPARLGTARDLSDRPVFDCHQHWSTIIVERVSNDRSGPMHRRAEVERSASL